MHDLTQPLGQAFGIMVVKNETFISTDENFGETRYLAHDFELVVGVHSQVFLIV